MTEDKLPCHTITRVSLGNSDIIRASNGPKEVDTDLMTIETIEVELTPDFYEVTLADGSKTVITGRLKEYLDHNGMFKIDGEQYNKEHTNPTEL